MTTIVYKDKHLFVDSRAYSGDKTPIGFKTKLHRLPDGMFASSSTIIGAPERLLALLREKGVAAHVTEDLDADAIYVQDDGSVYFFSRGPQWTSIDVSQYLAIGSGAQYALGALAHGATGQEAMEVAIQLDLWSGHPIVSRQVGEVVV